MNDVEQLFEDFKGRCAAYSGLRNGIPAYDILGRRSVNLNQNQGATVYPFNGPCDLAGLVSDISVVLDKEPKGEVYVTISRTGGIVPFSGWQYKVFVEYQALSDAELSSLNPSSVPDKPTLVFTDSEGTELLNTDDLALKHSERGFWYFSDERGRNTVRYAEYATANDTDQPFLYPQSLTAPAKLISRCWSTCVDRIYYVGQEVHSNHLKLILDSGFRGEVTGNTIIIRTDTDRLAAEENVLKTINNLHYDTNNNINIYGDEACIAVSALEDTGFSEKDGKYATALPHTVTVRNDCSECCSCDDYEAQFHIINRLIEIHNYEAQYLTYLINYYQQLQSYYNETIDFRLANLLDIKCMPAQYQTTIGFSISNPSNQSLYEINARLEIETDAPNGRTKRNYVRNAVTIGDYPEYNFFIPELRAHSTWSGVLTVCFDECDKELTAKFSSPDIPWCSHKVVECTALMECNAN